MHYICILFIKCFYWSWKGYNVWINRK